MQFLHPSFLFGLGTLAIPILIHFVYKMKAPVVMFPSIRFLRQVDRKVAKRQKLQELLLLLMRCLALAVLAFALAGPVLKQFGNTPGSAGTAVVIVLDDSYSMSARDAGGPVFNGAKSMAAAILNTLKPGDSACILTSARKPVMTRDLNGLANELKGIEPSFGSRTLGAPVSAAMDLLRETEAAQREMYILSDFQTRSLDIARTKIDWTARNFSAMFVPVRAAKKDNLTLASFEQISPFAAVSTPFRVRAEIINRNNAPANTTLKFRVDGQAAAEQMVTLPAMGKTVVSVDLRLTKPGWTAVSAELGDDAVAADNTRWLCCDAHAYLGVLVCRPNPQGGQSRGFFIEKALNPGNMANTGVNIVTCTPTDFSNQNFDTLSAIFMVECGPQDEDGRRFLNNFVARGGGLVIVAGNGTDPDGFNKMFARESDAAGPLAPAKMTGAWGSADADNSKDAPFQTIRDVAIEHPLFSRLRRGDVPVDLSTAAFFRYARVEAYERSGAQVLARFADGSPAIVERGYGMGRVMLISSALHTETTNMPYKVAFLPLIHSLAVHLLTPGRADSLRVGDHVSLQLAKDQAPPSARLILSPKEKVDAKADALGAFTSFDFGPATTPGAFALEWSVGGKTQTRLAAVNVDPDEGSMEFIEPSAKDIPGANRVANEEELLSLLSRIRFGHNLSLPFLLAGLALVLGEAVLANWLAFGRVEKKK
ncbi:MAG: BatA and WFA domain-containing protein [Planctomycetota bacterium]